jgi:hypothetical protein
MTSNQIQRWIEANGIKDLRRVPTPDLPYSDHHYLVTLRCGGPSGIGDTVEQALDNARELNADWLPRAA